MRTKPRITTAIREARVFSTRFLIETDFAVG